MSNLRGNFFPERQYTGHRLSYSTESIQFEGEKWRIKSELEGTTVCLNKCSVDVTTAGMNDVESSCLNRCYTKLFDCNLLINKEMELHTIGHNNYQ